MQIFVPSSHKKMALKLLSLNTMFKLLVSFSRSYIFFVIFLSIKKKYIQILVVPKKGQCTLLNIMIILVRIIFCYEDCVSVF